MASTTSTDSTVTPIVTTTPASDAVPSTLTAIPSVDDIASRVLQSLLKSVTILRSLPAGSFSGGTGPSPHFSASGLGVAGTYLGGPTGVPACKY